VQAELPDTKGFAAASQNIPVEVIAEKITWGPSAERHLEAIGKFVDAGFDHLILVQIGPDYFFVFLQENWGQSRVSAWRRKQPVAAVRRLIPRAL
jgi:hypothetical protein